MLTFSAAGGAADGRRLGLAGVERAGPVGTHIVVPAIAVARDPPVDSPRHEVNSRDREKPRHELPPRQRKPDARPGIRSAVDAPAPIHSLHPAHGLFAIHLRETRRGARIMQVDQLDAPARIDAAHAHHARAAEAAGSVVKHAEFRHAFSWHGPRPAAGGPLRSNSGSYSFHFSRV